MPNIIEKVKSALHSDTPSSHYDRQGSDVPGSFPDDRREHGGVADQISSKHRDGRDYVAPSGTHVGDYGHGGSSYERGGPNTTTGYSDAPRVDDRHLMDPADPRTGSNLMNTTGAGGDPVTRSSDAGMRTSDAGMRSSEGGMRTSDAGMRTSDAAGIGSGSHHNKLHKRDDPRAYETSSVYPETGQLGTRDYAGTGVGHGGDGLGTSGSLRRQEGHDNLMDSDRPGHHHGAGTAAGVGAAGVGAGALASQVIPDRTRHSHEQQPLSDPSRTSHVSGSRLSGDNHTYGQGVYNTVTGHGSGEDRLDDRRHAAPGETLHGTHGGTSAPAAAIAGAATAAGMHKSSGHHDYAETSRHAPTTGSGVAGSEGWPLGDSTGATDRKPVGSHSVRTNTVTTTNTSTYPPTTTRHPDHNLDSRGPTSTVVGSGAPRLPEQSFDSSGPTSHVPGTTTSSRLPDQSLDSRGPTSHVPGTASSRLPDQSLDSRGPASQVPEPVTARHPEHSFDARGPVTGAGGAHVPHDTSKSHPTSSNVAAAAPAAAAAGAASGGAGHHYGPGHRGSRVIHKCQSCGHDNDISEYFGQNVTYRLG